MNQRYIWNVEQRMTSQQYDALNRFGRLLAKLLFVRGVRTEQQGMAMIKDIGSKYDPYQMKNMKKVVLEIKEAIKNQKRITIFGDYDADGVTASAILIKAIRALGGIVDSYIPDRFLEGYGLNKEALKKIKENGTDLVISVDCGIRSIEESEYAHKIQLPLIITDHHEPGEVLPQPMVLLSPKQPEDEYPDKNLAGCGIALKIAQALSANTNLIDMNELIMIATIGTVADLVPLLDENRSLVRQGLLLFKRKKCLFLDAMSEKAGFDPNEITSSLISYAIAPRLNAAGRMKHASTALNLLLSETKEEALTYAAEIEKMNTERQQITQKIHDTAEKSVETNGVPFVICIKDKDYSMGVVGLAAAKLTEKYNRPTFVGHTDGKEIRLSGRSIQQFNMIEAMDEISDVFLKYGGHAMAAGATVSEDKWDEFVKEINRIACEKVDFDSVTPEIKADLCIPSELISLKACDTITLLEPFGESNKQPLFEVDNLKVVEHAVIGTGKNHLKLKLKNAKGQVFDAIAFRSADREPELPDYIDIICAIEKNTWHGNDNVQLRIVDMRTAAIISGFEGKN